MPRVGFEPTIPAFGRAKTFHALDRTTSHCGRTGYSATKIRLAQFYERCDALFFVGSRCGARSLLLLALYL
jgi:hypothetical protein